MSDYERLLELVDEIRHPAIKDFVHRFLKEEVPDYFQHIPASSSGRYHPEYALGDGGLLRHTIAAITFFLHVKDLEFWKFTSNEKDQMLAAIILHDTFKQGVLSQGVTTRDHADLACALIKDYATKCDSGLAIPINNIAQLVRTHMGQWGAIKPQHQASFVVHLCDFLASRKDVSVDMMMSAWRR